MAIKSIILDLGGVLLDIDFSKTRDALVQYGVANFDEYYQQAYSSPLFADLEKGSITPGQFYDGFRSATGTIAANAQLEEAWNALLIGFRTNSIALLSSLKQQYNLYLLSNTNAIHYNTFTGMFEKQIGGVHFNDLFHKAYYSHLIKQSKPAPSSYLFITKENNVDPGETLFVDDTLRNIEGAQAVGMQTLWLQNGMLLEEALPALLKA